MKQLFFILAILLLVKSGSAQVIKEDQLLSAFEEGNYEVVECKYIYTDLHQATTKTKFIWLKFHHGIFREAILYSAPFQKEKEMFFVGATLIVDSTATQTLWGLNEPVSVRRTKDDLLAEKCCYTISRFNELLISTLPKRYYY